MKTDVEKFIEEITYKGLAGVGDDYKKDPTSNEYCSGCSLKKPVGDPCPHGCHKAEPIYKCSECGSPATMRKYHLDWERRAKLCDECFSKGDAEGEGFTFEWQEI